MDIDLKKMHEIELDILKVVHALCEEKGVRYYLGYGTMLGAVRHGGFIPWDDDIDILMPRQDYERFLRLAERELPKEYIVKHPGNTKPYLYDFAKIEDKRTKIVETTYSYMNLDGGIYIDIFPLDGAPNNSFCRKMHLKHIEFWQQLLAMYYANPDKKRNFVKKSIVSIVKKIFDQDTLNARIVKNMRKYSFDESNYVGYYAGRENELTLKKYLGDPIKIEFEKVEFYGVEKPKEYLTAIYGDYMKLPPEQERIAHMHSLVQYR